jgi:hypothetical protein
MLAPSVISFTLMHPVRSDKKAYLHLLVVALGLVLAPSLYAQGYRIAPVPDWVKSVSRCPTIRRISRTTATA